MKRLSEGFAHCVMMDLGFYFKEGERTPGFWRAKAPRTYHGAYANLLPSLAGWAAHYSSEATKTLSRRSAKASVHASRTVFFILCDSGRDVGRNLEGVASPHTQTPCSGP